ncbi:MAG: protein phosphatase 2C domain-containing protein [Planctomycetota bacterium]
MIVSNSSTRKPDAAPAAHPSIPSPRPPFKVQSFGLSDRGKVRRSNEDCFLIAELSRAIQVHHTNLTQSKAILSCHRGHAFLVADGVGGSHAGEVASGLTVKTVECFLLNTLKRFSNLQANEEQAALRDLQNALLQADSRIFEETEKHPEWRGMATTLTMAFAVNWRLFVAHAGDSRCYLYSGGQLQQLTQDHTLTAELVRRGVVSPENQATHQWRHVVTNLLGGQERGVEAELHSLDLHAADVVLLCSDGLTEMVSEARIAAILQEEDDPQRACESLVSEANKLGGKDNITAIVARFLAS